MHANRTRNIARTFGQGLRRCHQFFSPAKMRNCRCSAPSRADLSLSIFEWLSLAHNFCFLPCATLALLRFAVPMFHPGMHSRKTIVIYSQPFLNPTFQHCRSYIKLLVVVVVRRREESKLSLINEGQVSTTSSSPSPTEPAPSTFHSSSSFESFF